MTRKARASKSRPAASLNANQADAYRDSQAPSPCLSQEPSLASEEKDQGASLSEAASLTQIASQDDGISLAFEKADLASEPVLRATGLTCRYGSSIGCQDVSLEVYPSEILALVGESGSGKTTVLNILSGRLAPISGRVVYLSASGRRIDLHAASESKRRILGRTEMGLVHQNPMDGLNPFVSAGANIAERPLSAGLRSYQEARNLALCWLEKVEMDKKRIDDRPGTYSGGMRQRLQIAKNLATGPRIVFLDEPTSGLDLSVQATLLDLIGRLQASLGLSAVLVTHDLAVARLLSQRIIVMRRGRVIESGLTDRVLDDPQESYTQLLVSSML